MTQEERDAITERSDDAVLHSDCTAERVQEFSPIIGTSEERNFRYI